MADYAQSLLASTRYALWLFFEALAVTALLLTGVSWWRERSLGALHPRRVVTALTPMFASLQVAWKYFDRLIFLALAILIITQTVVADTSPAPHSTEEVWGRRIFALFFLMYLGSVLRASGIPPGLPIASRRRVIVRIELAAFLFGLIAMFASDGGLTTIGLLAAVLVAIALGITCAIGSAAHRNALPVPHGEAASLVRDNGPVAIAFAFLTDVHLTAGNRPRVEVRPPGNERFARALDEMNGIDARWLILGGDLADHGSEDEWKEAREMLANFKQKHQGTRIIVAPGNHDLGTAYTTLDAYFAQVSVPRQSQMPWANGRYLRRYFEFAAALEKGLKTADGKPLSQIINKEEKAKHSLADQWRAGKHKSAARREELAAQAHRRFPDFPLEAWRRAVARGELEKFDELISPLLWAKRWFEYFPLQIRDERAREAVFVSNSIAPDPTLLGSAWGAIGEDQLQRLASLWHQLNGYRIYLVCHHPPVRWIDPSTKNGERLGLSEAVDWATQALLAEDVDGLRRQLADAPAAKEGKVVFMCGHRHGERDRQTRLGAWSATDAQGNTSQLGLIVEGASVADGAPIAAGWEDAAGDFKLGYLMQEGDSLDPGRPADALTRTGRTSGDSREGR